MHRFVSLEETRSALERGETTCTGVVQHCLERIRAQSHLNAFLEVFEKDALSAAAGADSRRAAGKAGRLSGLVVAVKDNICCKGHRVSAASRMLENFTSLYSATAVERLLAEDAVIIGRLNCDEFAMGSTNENSAFGRVLNPHDNTKIPGGSSGGSAAAVAAGLCHAALGSDTGGSVRQPASMCGVIGMKPTYGRVSRYGLIAFASSFDQIGIFANDMHTLAAVLECISGRDAMDSTSSPKPVERYSGITAFAGKAKIAYLKDCLEHSSLDRDIRTGTMKVLEELRKDGHTVEGVDFPYLDCLVPAYYVLTTAEASSNLARYDGLRYGYRSPQAQDMEGVYRKSRSEGFGKEVKRRIMLGTFVLSSGYYDAYYTRALKVRALIRNKTQEILSGYDFILSPTSPNVAFGFGEKTLDPVKMYLSDIFTVQANLSGIPAISLPLGQHPSGLPYGIQLMAGEYREAELLSLGQYLLEREKVMER